MLDAPFRANVIKLATNYMLMSAVETMGEAAAMTEMAMAHLSFLAEQNETAVVYLTRVAELMPGHPGLRIKIARHHWQNDNFLEALALLDTIQSAAPDVVQEKELLALTLANELGNADRARAAAERLFGLRLPSNAAISLATSMKKLEMTELAEALLSRVHRDASNDINTRALLMRTSISQGHKQVATEIAHQLLSETEGRSQGSRQGQSLYQIRNSALRVLGDSDRLKSMIVRTEDQLKRSPDSLPLSERLLEFYVAAGRSKEAAALRTEIEKLQPNTIGSLMGRAAQHESRQEYSEACEVHLKILEKDPQRYAQRYYEYLLVLLYSALLLKKVVANRDGSTGHIAELWIGGDRLICGHSEYFQVLIERAFTDLMTHHQVDLVSSPL